MKHVVSVSLDRETVVKIVSELWEENEKKEIPVALKVAALCHDLDRIYPNREVNTKNCSKNDYENRKIIHSGNSALIFFEKNNKFPINLLNDVSYLILRHEIGGNKNKEGVIFERADEFTQSYNLNIAANYLYYADKLSFFYSSIYEYSKRGKEILKTKIKFSIKGLPEHILKIIIKIKFDNDLINECFLEIFDEIKREEFLVEK